MRWIIIILIILSNIGVALPQEIINHEKLISDFDQFLEIIEETHPDPYSSFGGRMLFHKQALEVKLRIYKEGMTKDDFYFLLSAFISKLHDGHTYINFPNSPGQTEKEKMLPIQFRIVADGMIVISAREDWAGLIGHKLASVNNRSIEELLSLIQQYEPCENISGAYFILKNYLATKSRAKQIFKEMNESLEFTFLSFDNQKTKRLIPYLSPEDSHQKWLPEKRWDKMDAGKPTPFWFRFLDDENKIGYFAFYTTYSREVIELMKNWGRDFQPTLEMLYKNFNPGQIPENIDEALQKIPSLNVTFFNLLTGMKKNKSTHLVIDLRQNGGGWTPITLPTLYMLFGDKYFGYECQAEYNTRISELYLQKQNLTIEQYNKNRNTTLKVGDYNFGYFMGSNWPPEMSLKERRETHLSQNIGFMSGIELLKSQNGAPVYTPEIIIVTSPVTFSAAFQYLYFLRKLGKATIIGVAPRQAYNAGMETTPFTLPNTQLSGSVSNSYQLFMPDNLEKGKILVPDHEVTWEIYDKYHYDQDTEIRYIIDLIQNRIR
ncbi:hypothetical protein JW964_16580 [candidate division KSB1 bacterium]|nr:hypothetical protein [candidate division KSB1 bacterium]